MKQKELFLMQVELALIHNKPLILHCREAHDDMMQVIREFTDNAAVNRRSLRARGRVPDGTRRGWKTPAQGKSGSWQTNSRTQSPTTSVKTNHIKPHRLHGVWHCFGGTANQLQAIIAMGYYVGFDGNITYSADYSPLVKSAPLNRILLETDAPFLTPVPHRGTRNEPAYLPLVAQAVADYHATPLSAVIKTTTENAKTLFNLL